MFIMHLALQGCLKSGRIDYGVTADTGGHIRYVLELVEALENDRSVHRMEIVTRRFADPALGKIYNQPFEDFSSKTRIVRISDANSGYLPKEKLHLEIEGFVDHLCSYLENLDVRPDIIHAHYADAGQVAARIKEKFGIPYIFTAHSLGAVKAQTRSEHDPAEAAIIDKRITIEEMALNDADLVIASSRDEAERQYAHYQCIDDGRIRVIAPGAALEDFTDATPSREMTSEIDKFLSDPEKPVILAIARPVHKKNLKTVIDAFGQSDALKAMANLVIIGGVRDSLDDLEPECRDVWSELLELIDRHDLYGHIAYPKSHDIDHIPGIYALAAQRSGVFVNPALNEPFGLTLLEATASGLPVIATDSGGPNDIIECCQNGFLLNPTDVSAWTNTLLQIFSDRQQYCDFRTSGLLNINYYNWHEHTQIYLRQVSEILRQPKLFSIARRDALLCSDIDNTLIGDADKLARFGDWIADSRNIVFGIATGRSFHNAHAILLRSAAPKPEFLISSVGARIHIYDESYGNYVEDKSWSKKFENWPREQLANVIDSDFGWVEQSPLEQTSFKLSYFLEDQSQVDLLSDRLESCGLRSSIIWSHGKYLDILPDGVCKGSALEYVRKSFDIDPRAVVAAGDSGNDVAMLESVLQGIIVSNYTDNIGDLPSLKHCYRANQSYAAGIIEGMDNFLSLEEVA